MKARSLMAPSTCLRFSLAVLLLCGASLLRAQDWTVQTLSTRVSPNGQNVTLAIAIYAAASGGAQPVRHVLVYPQPGGTAQLKVANGTTALALSGPWVRGAAQLQARGVALVYVDPPSDAERRNLNTRPRREVQQDLAAALKQAQQSFPGAQVHLAGFSLVAPLLDIAADLEGFGKVVVASSAFRNNRSSDWSSLRKPVLMLHAPGAQCDIAPFPEAQALAQRSRFSFVQVGYEQQDSKEDCGRTSQHVLQGQEATVAQAVADWLEGQAPAPVIGYANPSIAWREEIITYQVPGTFGATRLEATLLLPDSRRFGTGPYPVTVFSHGDVEINPYKIRLRDMVVAREFLQMGVAVLMPARRGVGMSEGTYPKNFSHEDGDATYKARVQSEDVLPALAWLKTRPELDAGRLILSGQSAGGYLTMYIASQSPPGLIGAIDFSGGRNDLTKAGTGPGYLNRMMVDGFAEFGKNTRIPTLWVFAENDSRYTANTIRASYEAFQAAGGKARLLLNPPIEGDGHFIHHKPELWRAALKDYLNEIGVVTRAN
jgi:dienelactone hydrolase